MYRYIELILRDKYNTYRHSVSIENLQKIPLIKDILRDIDTDTIDLQVDSISHIISVLYEYIHPKWENIIMTIFSKLYLGLDLPKIEEIPSDIVVPEEGWKL